MAESRLSEGLEVFAIFNGCSLLKELKHQELTCYSTTYNKPETTSKIRTDGQANHATDNGRDKTQCNCFEFVYRMAILHTHDKK